VGTEPRRTVCGHGPQGALQDRRFRPPGPHASGRGSQFRPVELGTLGNDTGNPRQIAAHPLGRRLLLLYRRKLLWVELHQRGTRIERLKPRTDSEPARRLPGGSTVRPLLDVTRPDDRRSWGWGAWSGDGDCLYWLDRRSVLHKFQSPAWKETACVRITPGAEHLAMSSMGLATYCPEAQELIVFDPETLAVRSTPR
jgi:hypothetical protein